MGESKSTAPAGTDSVEQRARRAVDGVLGDCKVDVRLHALLVVLAAEHAHAVERLSALERAPLRYDGPHEVGKRYVPGAFVSFDGSLWHCNEATTCRPGDGPQWTLAVKRGRDARRTHRFGVVSRRRSRTLRSTSIGISLWSARPSRWAIAAEGLTSYCECAPRAESTLRSDSSPRTTSPSSSPGRCTEPCPGFESPTACRSSCRARRFESCKLISPRAVFCSRTTAAPGGS